MNLKKFLYNTTISVQLHHALTVTPFKTTSNAHKISLMDLTVKNEHVIVTLQ